MATANTADAWRQDGDYPDRSSAASRAPWPDRASRRASSRPVRTGPARPARPADRLRAAEARNRDAADSRAPPHRAVHPSRPAGRERGRFEGRRPDARADGRVPTTGVRRRRPTSAPHAPTAPTPTARAGRAAQLVGPPAPPRPSRAADGGRLRGIVAVLGMFLVTLAGAAVDSFVGIGLGMVTLVALVAVTAIATLVVRRRDLLSVVVAPPLVFVAVAALNIALAPSASFNLPTVATLLVRGFPTMAVATGVALVLGLDPAGRPALSRPPARAAAAARAEQARSSRAAVSVSRRRSARPSRRGGARAAGRRPAAPRRP